MFVLAGEKDDGDGGDCGGGLIAVVVSSGIANLPAASMDCQSSSADQNTGVSTGEKKDGWIGVETISSDDNDVEEDVAEDELE